jgi:hypothetical protein
MDAAAVLAELTASTQRLLTTPAEKDTWSELIMKLARARKVEIPMSISSLNPVCLCTPIFWITIIIAEKMPGVASIQNYLRGKFQQQYLVEELCSLTLTLMNILVLIDSALIPNASGQTKAMTPKMAYDVFEPLLLVIEGKLAYLLARTAGASSAKAASVGEATNPTSFSSPTLKEVAKITNDKQAKKAERKFIKKTLKNRQS